MGGGVAPETDCFALLDDSAAPDDARVSRLYTGFAHERRAPGAAQLDAVCAQVDDDLRAGLHAVVLADYEFDPDNARAGGRPGTLRFLLFHACRTLTGHEVAAWLAAREAADPSVLPADAPINFSTASDQSTGSDPTGTSRPAAPAGVVDIVHGIGQEEFAAAIARIHEALRAGDSYQVNFTYRMRCAAFGSPLSLYRRLRARQPVHFGALLALPDAAWVLSLSPELFLSHEDGTLHARPMKGTAPRIGGAGGAVAIAGASGEGAGADTRTGAGAAARTEVARDPGADDAQAARWLAADPKNRAENLMIVDLLRNDLGRVAETGSVKVPALFAVEAYPTVWQMTSSIEARLRAGTGFADLMRALYPCGSITGAPKRSTMHLIEALEDTPRGLYTGAIGWVDAPPAGHAVGDFCLSVAIRTLTLAPPSAEGLRPGTLGIGAGIVLDSDPAAEFEECHVKARFLTGMDPGLALFETMHATREIGVRFIERHLARLAGAATRFGFPCDREGLQRRLRALCATLADGLAYRVRVALDTSGMFEISHAPLTALPPGPVKIMLAADHGFAPTDSQDFLLRCKTTRRAHYDAAWRAAERLGGFDMLFVNRNGELTEGGRSNLFVKWQGRWWTPPLGAGVLPGVMRAVLLDDPAWQASERPLTLAMLREAEHVMVCNALRGALSAELVP